MRIIRPGVLTTLQDTGRYCMQHLGVPIGGAMDAFALRTANLLVGNTKDAAAFEVTLGGLSVYFEEEALIAVTGASLPVRINEQPVPNWRPVRVPAGSTLKLDRPNRGCRAYLSVAGGVDVPLVLNGRGTCLRANFGGHEGRALKQGDELRVGNSSPIAQRFLHDLRNTTAGAAWTKWFIAQQFRPAYTNRPTVRAMIGPEHRWFTGSASHDFFVHPYRTTPQVDRMGYRLQGPELTLQSAQQLLSTAVTAGTVQVPPTGQPIVLLADAQTTGGYPRIAQVTQVDLPLIAQLQPGDHVHFHLVDEDQARHALLQQERTLRSIQTAIALHAHTHSSRGIV
ncbi:biotin-dependent carboxyltransferase family protein [Deinococcus peraridilitoris]|nr:biotin-dependent carboxyltransferase family protein [Deinococcus peraridilitoris]